MEFNKGTVKNINKRLIAGMFALTLVTTPLCSCNGMKLKYEENSQGEIVCVKNIKYEYLKEYKVLILGKGEKQYFYIVDVNTVGDFATYETYDEYYDIFDGELIYRDDVESNFKMITVVELNDYLISYNMIKKEYSEQDLKELLEIIEIDYNKKTERQMIK